MNKIEYESYLKTLEWKQKRNLKLTMVSNKCEKCGCKAKHVHHTIEGYKHLGTYEEIFHLIALCESCHRREHGIFIDLQSKLNKFINIYDDIYITDLRDLGTT